MSAQYPEHDSLKNDDMRYFPRWEVNDRVLYHLDGEKKSYEGQTKDISCAGARITGDGHVAPHQKIKLTLELADGVKVNLNAHILWVKVENNQPQMGITFYDTPDDVPDDSKDSSDDNGPNPLIGVLIIAVLAIIGLLVYWFFIRGK